MFEFRHPHIETTINDNSYVSENLSNGTGSSVLFQPYFSNMGEDNVIKKYTNLTEFIAKNGKPVFKKHGQAIYNLTAWLRHAPVYGLRIMPEDATYANIVLSSSLKRVAGKSGDDLEIGTLVKTVENLTEKKQFLTAMKGLPTSEDSADLFNFLGFRIIGRGNYGKNYSLRIKANNPKSKTTEFRCYDISILSTNESGTVQVVEGPFSVSLSPNAINLAGESLFIETVINAYSEIIRCTFDEEAYESYVNKLVELKPGININKFDILFGKDEDMKDHEGVVVKSESAALDHAVGIYLLSGTDGELEGVTSQSERATIMNKLYKKAYSGELVREVLNKRAFPFDVILDAAFPIDVKNEMKALCETRQDCFPYFDAGLTASYSPNAAVNFRKTQLDFDTYVGSLIGQSRVIKDPYGISNIEVTFTYTLASKIPVHDAANGCQYPIAGPNYGLIGRLTEGELSFNPDEYQQEDLYNAQINYVTQDYSGEGEIGSQLTLQKKLSSLSDANNVRALFKIVRQIENIASKYKFEFSDATGLASFQGELNSLSATWVDNRACSSLELTVYQTEYDKTIKTAKVKVELVFNTLMETIIIDVNVGR